MNDHGGCWVAQNDRYDNADTSIMHEQSYKPQKKQGGLSVFQATFRTYQQKSSPTKLPVASYGS